MPNVTYDGHDPNSGVIQLTVETAQSDVRLTETPTGVSLSTTGCTLVGPEGGPGFPVSTVQAPLPADAIRVQLEVQVLETLVLTPRAVVLAPMQPPRAANAALKPSLLAAPSPVRVAVPHPAFVPPSQALYDRARSAPPPAARLTALTDLAGAKLACIEICPVFQEPEGRLCLRKKIALAVRYERQARSVAAPLDASSEPQRDRLRALLELLAPGSPHGSLEAALEAAPRLDSTRQVQHLILTDNVAWDAAQITPGAAVGDLVQELERLAAWRRQRGIESAVITISDVVAGKYGNFRAGARDLQEVIRNFLKWAYGEWSVTSVLLGGDVEIVPTREAHLADYEGRSVTLVAGTDPAPGTAVWVGNMLRVRLPDDAPGTSSSMLCRENDPDAQSFIPYDPGEQLTCGWSFATADYAAASPTPTKYLRVRGKPEAVKANLRWLYAWGAIPTDFYFASLKGDGYGLTGKHDWDLAGNGVWGKFTGRLNLDRINFAAHVSVGRAPVSSALEGRQFVDKVIAYETLGAPDGGAADLARSRKLLFAAADWISWPRFWPDPQDPPADDGYHYYQARGASLLKIKAGDVNPAMSWHVWARIDSNPVLIAYATSASATSPGWCFVKSATDWTPSTTLVSGQTLALPSAWILVRGPLALLQPQCFLINSIEEDGAVREQEQLRTKLAGRVPGLDDVKRLYEDALDTPPDALPPPEMLTHASLERELGSGCNLVVLSGHGNTGGMAYLMDGVPALNAETCAHLTDPSRPFVGFHDGCDSGDFTAVDAISEMTLTGRGGAAAFVGHSRHGWLGYSWRLQHKFFESLANTNKLGLLHDSRLSIMDESWPLRMGLFALNLQGDPEMRIWRAAARTLAVTHPAHLEAGASALEVSVRCRSAPEAGASVVVSSGNDVVARGRTDRLGRCVLSLAQRAPQLALTVSAEGALPVRRQFGVGRHWPALPGSGALTSIYTAAGKTGALYVFGTSPRGEIVWTWQVRPTEWSPWATLPPTNMAQLVVGQNADGRLELLSVGFEGQVYHAWQTAPDGPWSSVRAIGEPNQQGARLACARGGDDRLEVVAMRPGDGLWLGMLVKNGGGAWAGSFWQTGAFVDVAMASNADGRLEVFAVTARGEVHHAAQTRMGDDDSWTELTPLAGISARRVVALSNVACARRIELFAIGADSCIYRTWRLASGSWHTWQRIGAGIQGQRLAVAQNADGRLEAFVIGHDCHVYRGAQVSASDEVWSAPFVRIPWLGDTAVELSAAANGDGRLELFVLGADRCVYHVWQQAPNGAWLIAA